MAIDPLLLGVFSHYFRAAAEAMGYVLQRTAYTTYVKESNDFATGLLTPSGEHFAYSLACGTTSFVGLSFGAMIEELGPWNEGDVAVTNCPYLSHGVASHLPDYNMIRPIFVEGRLVAFSWGFIHASDMGGIVPSSILPSAHEIYQEGIRIPPVKLYRGGVLQPEVKAFLLANVRIPEKNWGDLNALVAALGTGEQRVRQAAAKWGLDVVVEGTQALLDYAERRARGLIERIPPGTYEFVDYLEDDVVSDMPVRIVTRLTREEAGGLHIDFTGTDPQVGAAFNLASAGRHPYLCYAMLSYFRSLDPTVPFNAGLMRPIRFTAPEGSIVNATPPAACGVRFAVVMTMYGVLQAILAKALPGEVPAIGSGQASIISVSLLDMATGTRHVSVVQPMIGGSGGRADKDGIDGCDFSQGALSNTPVEAIENEIPILIREYSVLPDSAGPGRFRGGMAFRLDFQALQSDATVTARGMERFKFQPRGMHGGGAGATGDCWIDPGKSTARRLGKIDRLTLEESEVMSVRTPGGGGYGNPFERDPALVLRDVLDGLVTIGAARQQYGVVVKDDRVDEAASREERASRDGRRPDFDPGAARAAHEAVFTPAVAGALAEALYSLPSGIRYSAKSRFFNAIRQIASRGETVTPHTIAQLKQEFYSALKVTA
jgi:N-methylhydantoinase B